MRILVQTTCLANGELSALIAADAVAAQPGAIESEAAARLVAAGPLASSVELDLSGVSEWDSASISWVFRVQRAIQAAGRSCRIGGLPNDAAGLLELAGSVPERKGARRSEVSVPLLEGIGQQAVQLWSDLLEWCDFVGELLVSLSRALRGKARIPVRDIWVTMEECGPSALPIVTLISVLVGVILGFIGAQQLRQFGAEIYVANLVGIAMCREMGGIMAGIIMAGRTGAAFAAQLGTMQVNEEIDALKTFGFSPMEYLVVPRVMALIVMMPLLAVYADVLGMLGGALISSFALDISLLRYFEQLTSAVFLKDVALGVAKSCVFGILIAVSGCLYGMRCGRSASAVGIAVTSAVVAGIVAIVVSDAVFAVMCEVLKI